MASGPTLTALMPVKDYHARYLHAAVGSMLEQTRPDWRLLVICEPSGRGELTRVLAQELRDPRIDLVENTGRKLAGAFNTGMREAETPFVAILFGDDLWSTDAVEVLNRNMDVHPDTDFFHSSRRVIDDEGRAISPVFPSGRKEILLADFVPYSPVKHLLCWRRDKALAIGGMDESLNSVGPDDHDFPWTMAEHGAAFRAIPDCLYMYRDHREHYRLTTHLPLSHHKRELARIMRKHGVEEARIAAAVDEAQDGFLRQCLYRSRLDRLVKGLLGHDARTGWRESYR